MLIPDLRQTLAKWQRWSYACCSLLCSLWYPRGRLQVRQRRKKRGDLYNIAVLSLPLFLESLICVCDDCVNSQICEAGPGGRCYSQVLNYRNRPTVRRRRCYERSYVDLCGTSSPSLVIECCDTDLCNANLLPLPTTTTTASVATTSTPPQTTSTPEATAQPEGIGALLC